MPFTRVGYGRASASRTEALRLGDSRGSLLSATTSPLYDQYSHGTSRASKSFSVCVSAAGSLIAPHSVTSSAARSRSAAATLRSIADAFPFASSAYTWVDSTFGEPGPGSDVSALPKLNSTNGSTNTG